MVPPPPLPFAIDVARSGRRAVLGLSGELDLSVEPQVAAALADVASAETIVVIDLRALTFIDSSGVRALIEARRRCAELRCALYLVPGTEPVQRVLRLCGVQEHFEVLDDPADSPTLTAVPDLPAAEHRTNGAASAG